MSEGSRPFIGASDSNNGVTAWVDNSNESIDSNVLGVNYNGSVGETFYHPYECIFSDDVKRLHIKNGPNSKYIFLFLKTILLQQKCKYEYGYKFNEQRMSRQTILLPATQGGTPDWKFMESFMRSLENRLLERTLEIFKDRVSVNKCKMGGVKWKPFKLIQFFNIKKGNQNNMSSLSPGYIPLISAKNCDNGLKSFIIPNGKTLFGGNVLSLNLDGDGGAGISYYQPFEMALDSHVASLCPKQPMSKYQLLFISMCITKQRELFGHGYSLNASRLKALTIMLPVGEDNNPLWNKMDRFMRCKESEEVLAYLKYCESLLAV